MFFIWQGFCHLVIGKKRQIDLKNFRFVIKTALAFYTKKTDRTYCPVCCSYSLSLPICISTKSSTLSASASLDLMPSKARSKEGWSKWRTHDWSHGLPTVRQAFLIQRAMLACTRRGLGAQSIDNLATRLHLPFCRLSCFICPMHCLPAVSYSDSLPDILTLTVLLRCRL